MTRKQVNEITDSILARIPRVMARDDDPRIAAGELLTEEQARSMLRADVQQTLAHAERELIQWVEHAFAEAIRLTRRPLGRTKAGVLRRRKCELRSVVQAGMTYSTPMKLM
jgi:hypothetical protein